MSNTHLFEPVHVLEVECDVEQSQKRVHESELEMFYIIKIACIIIINIRIVLVINLNKRYNI